MKNKKLILTLSLLPCLPVTVATAISLSSCNGSNNDQNNVPSWEPDKCYKTKDGAYDAINNKISYYYLSEPNPPQGFEYVVIPEEVELENGAIMPIDEIGYYSFHSNRHGFENLKIKSVFFNQNIKTIGKGAFQYNALTGLTLPNSLETLYEEAFYDNQIQTLILSNNPKFTIIPRSAFGFNRIENIQNLNNIKYIADYAFDSAILKDFNFLKNSKVEFIGFKGFGNYKGALAPKILLPKTLKGISERAFYVYNKTPLGTKINNILGNKQIDDNQKEQQLLEVIDMNGLNWQEIPIYKLDSSVDLENKDQPFWFPYTKLALDQQPKSFLDWFKKVVFIF